MLPLKYLIYRLFKQLEIFTEYEEVKKEERRKILKKLVTYCIPFIIINVANTIYNFVDMVLVIRGLNHLGFPAADVETISSIFTTWGAKLISVVTAIATGLVISLIPNIVEAYTKKDEAKVNEHFNKILQVLLYVILPLTIFLSIYATPVWSVFYNESHYGPLIFKYTILLATLDSAYIMICSALQGLSKTKLIYTSVAVGLITKTILDLPLIYLFAKLGIPAYYGAIMATTIGYLLSLIIPLVTLNQKYNFSYKKTFKSLPKLILTTGILIVINLIIRPLIFSHLTSRIEMLLGLALVGIISFIIYFILNKKLLIELMGEKFFKSKKKIKDINKN